MEMRHLIGAIVLNLGALMCGVASAEVETATEKSVAVAVRAAVSTYRLDGVAGLIIKTKDCYATRTTNWMHCFYFDLASRYIDRTFIEEINRANGARYPFHEFFADEPLAKRAGPLLATFDNVDEANHYLRTVSELIHYRVYKELSLLKRRGSSE